MCEGINCGIGGDCLSGNCTCQTGYTNVENFCEETCVFTPCENNGTCIVTIINDIPTPECECPVNYAGTTCNLDLCSDIQCGNGTCIGGSCQCDERYVNDDNVCVDICESINCGTGGYCTEGICNCGEGYANIKNVCVDLCEGVDCGNGGTCSGGNCDCQTGYVNIENICEETCALAPCQDSNISMIIF